MQAAITLMGFLLAAAGGESLPEPGLEPTRFTAVVTGYHGSAAWDHFEGGGFAAYDAIEFTILDSIEVPKKLRVLVAANDSPVNSPFRKRGTRFEFEAHRKDLKREMYWGSLNKVRVIRKEQR